MCIRKLTGVSIVACLSTAFMASVAFAQETVRVGLQAVPTDEVYKARNWGEAYDLKVEVSSYSSATDSIKAFLANRVDIANGGAARLVTMAAVQPDDFYLIAVNQYGGDRYGVFVAIDSSFKTIEDLKGKKIGAVTGSGTYNTFRVFLEENGLAESDFQVVNMKVEDLRAAVQQGIIDAAVGWEPHVAIAETMGVAKRIISLDGVNESPNFVLVRRDFADANREAVVKYVATLIDLGTLIKNKPDEAAALASEQISKSGVEVDKKALEIALTRIKMDPELTDDLLNELVPIAESMAAANKIKAVPEFKQLVNLDFYNEAVELAKSR